MYGFVFLAYRTLAVTIILEIRECLTHRHGIIFSMKLRLTKASYFAQDCISRKFDKCNLTLKFESPKPILALAYLGQYYLL
jgi:hypothetical protein